MYLSCSDHIIVVEVDDEFALIDKSSGLIHILDSDNLSLYHKGCDFECHSTEMVVSAKSPKDKGNQGLGLGQGQGKGKLPPGQNKVSVNRS